MALIYDGVKTYMIHLVGYWHSNDMFHYLYVQVEPLMRKYSQLMVTHGNYKFLPHMATAQCY